MPTEIDIKYYLALVGYNGMALKDVPDDIKTAEICMAAVKADNYALEFVPDALKTAEMCKIAVVPNGAWTFQWVPDALKTPEMCLIVAHSPIGHEFIPKAMLTDEMRALIAARTAD